MEFKKLTALLLCALTITGAALAAKEDVASDVATSETKSTRKSRSSRNGRKTTASSENNGQWTGPVTDTVVSGGYERRHGHYHGGSCSTGACGSSKPSCGNKHACRERNCGQCHRAAIPPKPCCEKAVTVRTEPCLHKQVQYSWTCPVDYTETNCPTC